MNADNPRLMNSDASLRIFEVVSGGHKETPSHRRGGFHQQTQLASNPFEFSQPVGITEAEAGYARSHDEVALVEILRAHGGFPVRNPDRQSVV